MLLPGVKPKGSFPSEGAGGSALGGVLGPGPVRTNGTRGATEDSIDYSSNIGITAWWIYTNFPPPPIDPSHVLNIAFPVLPSLQEPKHDLHMSPATHLDPENQSAVVMTVLC